jgi:hypothetical protein
MENQDGVRKFEYRPCRIAAGFEIEFAIDGKTILGICEDLSQDGIRATLDAAVTVGSIGMLSFNHSCGVLEIEAQVTHANRGNVGLVFLFQTPWERGMVNALIASIQSVPEESRVNPYQ